ncbi:hypothetical protein BDF20DRAFT_911648 [Mycotypha africana]|uniref:uncharacterized protein n=1 Tax=Mycotypha africana TaxID=64632 RepID=UPI0022FFCA2A|nr:uncharacterized protein BDF20DRAFT_911648 [Mycotypha africana]KAI8984562.1 hypothetical protein BDF20DRAFT_911648 [Mycotypha africana]
MQNALGYYTHVASFNEGHHEHNNITLRPSITDTHNNPSKTNDFEPLRRHSQQTMTSSISPPNSTNTSSSSLGEVRQAERCHSQVPTVLDTIKSLSISSKTDAGRNYHFNRLKELMETFDENQQTNTTKFGYNANVDTEATVSLSSPPFSSFANSRSHQKSRLRPTNAAPLKRYDSSKIVRYTLTDKALSPNSSTSSNYHQRLNAYDEGDNLTNTDLTSPTTSKSTFENHISQLPLSPPRPIFDPTATTTLPPESSPWLTNNSYYEADIQNIHSSPIHGNNDKKDFSIAINANHYSNDFNSDMMNISINETESGNSFKEYDRVGSKNSSGTATTVTDNSHYSSMYNRYANQVCEQYNRNLFESLRNNKCHPLSLCSPVLPLQPSSPAMAAAAPLSPNTSFSNDKQKNDPLLYITTSSPPPESVFGDKIKYKEKYEMVWRPYFTYITTLIMLAYFIGLLAMSYRLTGRAIQLSPFNVMIGPSAQTLVYTGARYLPCIRPSSLYPATDHIYQCPYTKAIQPTTKPLFNDQNIHFPFYFTNNMFFHESSSETDSTNNVLCQLQDVCGGSHFFNAERPDQGYRFISALFMHSGIIQFGLNVAVHLKFGGEIEKRIHPIRYGILWLVSGVFGYLFSALFVPENNVTAGCSVALMGVVAFLFIDLIRNWKCVAQPVKILLYILAFFITALIIGLLPGYDNFAHLGGFIGGIIVTLIILPTARLPGTASKKYEYREYTIQIWLLRMLAVAFLAILIWIFTYWIVENGNRKPCYLCQFFACLPISDLCSPYYTQKMLA